VKNGSFKGETKLKVNDLTSGNYLISIALENGEKVTEKLIIGK
jgi:hypothetical protein